MWRRLASKASGEAGLVAHESGESLPAPLFERKVAFIDVEASAWPHEGGYAIEVGVARDDASLETRLIRPLGAAWSAKAEATHGIGRSVLEQDGAAAQDVAIWLNEALVGYAAFSDNPEFDAAWLAPLYDAANVAPSFVLYPVTLAFAAFDCASDYTLIRESAALEVPQMHRAGPDALRHLVAWRMARTRWRDAPCGFNL
jgi:hypothetical protein